MIKIYLIIGMSFLVLPTISSDIISINSGSSNELCINSGGGIENCFFGNLPVEIPSVPSPPQTSSVTYNISNVSIVSNLTINKSIN